MLTRQLRELERQAQVIEQSKNNNMKFQIAALAQSTTASEFMFELDNQGIEYDIEVMDDMYDANQYECSVMVDDVLYVFNDGRLMDTMYGM